MTQGDLLTAPAPRVSRDDVTLMIECLRGQGWLSARQFRIGAYGWTERALRATASASQGRIISGQKGYCLIEEATVEEARHAAAWLRHQGNQMIQRAHEIEQAMHRRTEAA